MKFKKYLFVVILFLSASSAYSQSHSNDEKALKQAVQKLVDAQTAFDGAGLDKLFTSDYVEISPIGELDTRAEVLDFYSPKVKAARGASSVAVEAADHSIRVYDKFAIVIAKLNFKIIVAGKPIPPRSMRATMVFSKQKENWKLASAQYTSILVAQPPAPPVK